MQSINFKSSQAQAASAYNGPKADPSVWRNKLEAAHSDHLAKILQRAGIISREQYCDAQEIAESLNKSIDQVIVTSFLSEQQSLLCSAAMSYVERGLIIDSLASDALMVANTKNISFVEGLRYFGYGW